MKTAAGGRRLLLSTSWVLNLFRCGADDVIFLAEIFRCELPVEELVQNSFEIFRPRILVVEIVGVLPNIDGEQAVRARRHRVLGIARLLDRELAALGHKPGPAGAELILAGGRELFNEGRGIAEVA